MAVAPGEATPPGDGPHLPADAPAARWDRLAVMRVALLFLVAANIRTVILALAPVLPDVHQQLHLDETEVGLLTTLPVLLLGAGSIAGSAAVTHLGVRRTLVAGLVVVGMASALRGTGGAAALFGGSVLLGLTISVLQPALPSVAQAWFGAQVGLATAIYGNGFVTGEAVAASITLPFVVPLVGGWPHALEAWGLPCVLLGLVFLLPIGAVPAIEGQAEAGWLPDLRDPWTWRLGAFQAGGSALYFGTNAFIPTELHAVGHAGLVTPCLAALNISQLGAALAVGLLAHLGARTRPMMVGFGAVAGAGVVLVALLPGPVAVVGCGLIGLCSAAGFVVALALPAIVARPAEVHRVSAGMFMIGYLAAFVLPLIGGFAWDRTGQPRAALVPALLGAVLVAGALGRARRDGGADPVGSLASVSLAARAAVERA